MTLFHMRAKDTMKLTMVTKLNPTMVQDQVEEIDIMEININMVTTHINMYHLMRAKIQTQNILMSIPNKNGRFKTNQMLRHLWETESKELMTTICHPWVPSRRAKKTLEFKEILFMIWLEKKTGEEIPKEHTWLVQLTTSQRTKPSSATHNKPSYQVRFTMLEREEHKQILKTLNKDHQEELWTNHLEKNLQEEKLLLIEDKTLSILQQEENI